MHTIFQFIILTFVYSSTCFGRFPAHHQELSDCSGSLWFYLRILVRAVLCLWSRRPWTQHGYHHDTKVKPEAATAVIELLIIGGRTPETCWAVNKRQDNKLENCCIWLVIYLNFTMMHGLTNLKVRCNNFSNLLSWRLFTAQHVLGVLMPIIRSSTTAVADSGFTFVSVVIAVLLVVVGPVNRPDHDQQHCYHHAQTVIPESATAVVELLMMGVRKPETCWAVNKRQDNKLEKLLHLVDDLFELYDDARTYKL